MKRINETWWIAVINDCPKWPYLELTRKNVVERLRRDNIHTTPRQRVRIAKLNVQEAS